MAYFQNFETLTYDVVGDGNPKLFTHILRRVKINDLDKFSKNFKIFKK